MRRRKELGLEGSPHGFHHPVVHVHLGEVWVEDPLAADVRGRDDHRVLEADRLPVTLGEGRRQPSSSSASSFSTEVRKGGRSETTVSQTTSRSMPKYWWTRMFRMPVILDHGISGV